MKKTTKCAFAFTAGLIALCVFMVSCANSAGGGGGDKDNCLTFKAVGGPVTVGFSDDYSGFGLSSSGITMQKKGPGDTDFVEWNYNSDKIELKDGDTVSFKSTKVTTLDVGIGAFSISGAGKIEASGSVTSLIDGSGADPNVSLWEGCFMYLFSDCKNLTKAPELPAVTLKAKCYAGMFSGCTGLTTATVLPATVMANSCYSNMFFGCTRLTKVPALPATTLADYCYSGMFEDCILLEIQATKFGDFMVEWKIPATVAKLSWNYNMFAGCPNVDFGSGSKMPELNTTYYQKQ